MSRTDKDRPEWVRSADPTVASVVEHRCFPRSSWIAQIVECDLGTGRGASCRRYEASSERNLDTCVPDWFIRADWTGPDRCRLRMAARAAVTDFRANGDTAVDLPTDQHRHRSVWSWW